MKINAKSLVSISEANRNFSKVAKKVNKDGTVVIMKNNKPRYVLLDYEKLEDFNAQNMNEEHPYEIADDEDVETVASELLAEYSSAFEDLAK